MPTFPEIGVLDDFNRANGSLGANWSVLVGDPFEIASNRVVNSSGNANSAYWNSAIPGGDCEAFITFVQRDSNDEALLFVAMSSPGASWNGYAIGINPPQIYRVDGGSRTEIGSSISGVTVGDGDSIGIRFGSGQIQYHFKNGSDPWALVGVATDSTYSAAGFIGFLTDDDDGWEFDNFGGNFSSQSVVRERTISNVAIQLSGTSERTVSNVAIRLQKSDITRTISSVAIALLKTLERTITNVAIALIPGLEAPTLIAPLDDETVSTPITFQWQGQAFESTRKLHYRVIGDTSPAGVTDGQINEPWLFNYRSDVDSGFEYDSSAGKDGSGPWLTYPSVGLDEADFDRQVRFTTSDLADDGTIDWQVRMEFLE